MPEIKKLIRCDECQQFTPMKEDRTFSNVVLFEHPDHWFFLGFYMGTDIKKISLCSWLCTKDYVDRMYSDHHEEDQRMGR